jgi:hypothetical protein
MEDHVRGQRPADSGSRWSNVEVVVTEVLRDGALRCQIRARVTLALE